MSTEQTMEEATITVENVGGIDETEVTFPPGVNVLAGENATNRTSLLRAVMAALGSTDVSIKGDVDEAHVELAIDGETYSRELTRQGSTVSFDGDPYLEDPTRAGLFAFLLESNDARRAVATNEDLRDVIMRPIDTDEIRREIDRLVEERQDIERELEQLDSLKARLPALEERRTKLQEEVEETRGELAAKEEELEAENADVEETREEKDELESRLQDLRSMRSELEDVRYDLETERDSLESTRSEKRDLADELDDLPETPAGDIEELESRIERLRDRKRTTESELAELQSVIQFNQELLEEANGDVLSTLGEIDRDDDNDVTEELLADETVTCWTCGTEVPSDQIESTVDSLQDLSRETLSEVSDIEDELDELTDDVNELREIQRRRDDLERRISRAENEIERSEENTNRLTERREELQDEVAELEAEIEDLEDDSYEDVLELHREANQLEYELGRTEGELEDVEEEITDIEERLGQEGQLKAQREELSEEIGDLRTRIERIETRAIEEFNEHMETVLEILEYDNLERIWLERVEREVRQGRRKVQKGVFELHIVRKTASGTTYEDTVDHLSESEREVTGLVFALAGYLAHEVYETVPFMLLDSLEAIDADRIATLIEYLEGYSDYLLVALLPEDAAGIEGEYNRITGI